MSSKKSATPKQIRPNNAPERKGTPKQGTRTAGHGKPGVPGSNKNYEEARREYEQLAKAGKSVPIPQPNLMKIIPIAENQKYLPTYTKALTRPSTEQLPTDELDAIQGELELLLSTAALRYRGVKEDMDTLDDKTPRRTDAKSATTSSATVSSTAAGPSTSAAAQTKSTPAPKSTPVKAAAAATAATSTPKLSAAAKAAAAAAAATAAPTASTKKSATKRRSDGTIAKKTKLPKKVKVEQKTKAKLSQTTPLPLLSPPQTCTDDSLDAAPSTTPQKPMFPKNDVPNKFWLSVEPYCMAITQEDIKFLDDMIDEYKGKTLPEIPALGAHYAQQWANEDLRDEQDNSNLNAKANKRFAGAGSNEISSMLENSRKSFAASYFGPFTQRLLTSLIEINEVDPKMLKVDKDDSVSIFEPSTSQPRHIEAMLKNGVAVEKQLKKELFELGLFDEEYFNETEDEVLNELTRVVKELQSITEFNLAELHALKEASEEEIKRLEIKTQLDVVDQKVSAFLAFGHNGNFIFQKFHESSFFVIAFLVGGKMENVSSIQEKQAIAKRRRAQGDFRTGRQTARAVEPIGETTLPQSRCEGRFDQKNQKRGHTHDTATSHKNSCATPW